MGDIVNLFSSSTSIKNMEHLDKLSDEMWLYCLIISSLSSKAKVSIAEISKNSILFGVRDVMVGIEVPSDKLIIVTILPSTDECSFTFELTDDIVVFKLMFDTIHAFIQDNLKLKIAAFRKEFSKKLFKKEWIMVQLKIGDM